MITSRISTNTWVIPNEDTAYHRKIISDWRCACWCRLDLDRKRVTNKYYHPSSGDDCFISIFFGSSVSTRLKAALVLSFIPIFQHSTDYYYWQLVRETGWPWPWTANGAVGSISESMGQVADISSVLVFALAGLLFGKSLARRTTWMQSRDSR